MGDLQERDSCGGGVRGRAPSYGALATEAIGTCQIRNLIELGVWIQIGIACGGTGKGLCRGARA